MNSSIPAALIGSIFVTLSLCSVQAHAAKTLDEIESQIIIDLPIERIQLAIVRAGAMRKWQITEKAPGHLEGVVIVRKGYISAETQMAVIDIRFDTNRYTITYNRSENLDYKNGKIDKQFNEWIHKLDRDIKAMLTYM